MWNIQGQSKINKSQNSEAKNSKKEYVQGVDKISNRKICYLIKIWTLFPADDMKIELPVLLKS